MKVHFTEAARSDLRAIREYIAQDSPAYARGVVKRIRAAAARLKRFPQLGGMVEEWGRPDVRELIQGNYRIIYLLAGKEVKILAVVHAARRLPSQPDL